MFIMYKCKECQYSTEYKHHFEKHLQTKKHQKNVLKTVPAKRQYKMVQKEVERVRKSQKEVERVRNTEYANLKVGTRQNQCPYCLTQFETSRNYINHLKKCPILHMDYDLKRSNNDVTELRRSNDDMRRRLDFFEKHTDKNSDTLKSATRMGDKAMSALNYVMVKYDNAPPLEQITDKEVKCILYNGGDEPEKDYFDTEQEIKQGMAMLDCMMAKFNEKTLIPYLGDGIVKIYKTTDPMQQSIWASDCARLSYLVNKVIVENGKKITKWKVDKKGMELADMIIKPILDQLTLNLDEELRKGVSGDISPDRLLNVVNFKSSIMAKKIQARLIRYIAPELHIGRDDIRDKDIVDLIETEELEEELGFEHDEY